MTTLPPIGSYDLDDDLLEAVRATGRARLRVYPVRDVAVVLGRGSKPEQELRLDPVLEDGVPVLRRRGGGCAVVLDPGNVIVSLVSPKKGFGGGREAFGGLSAWVIDALGRLGIPGIRQRGISDLTMGDRKVGGACIYRPLGLLYYSTTLLVTPDIDLSERYLQHPPREPDYRAGRSHADFMGKLSGPGRFPDAEGFAFELGAALAPRSPVDESPLLVEVVASRRW